MTTIAAYGNLDGGVYQLADFNQEHVEIASYGQWISDIRGQMKYTFQLYLDSSYGYNNRLFQFSASDNQQLAAWLLDSSICFSNAANSLVQWRTYSIKDYSKQVLSCDVRVNPYASNTFPYYFTINSVQQASTNISASSGQGQNSRSYIGNGSPYSFADIGTFTLDNATIWNIQITEISTNTVKHEWNGWPAGNTIQAWQDTVGSYDAIDETITNYRNDIYGGDAVGVYAFGGRLLVPQDMINTLSLSVNNLYFDGIGYSDASVVGITSNTTWSITKGATWITTNPTGGSGNGSVVVSVSENNTGSDRSSYITVSGSGVSNQTCNIFQESKTMAFTLYDTYTNAYLYANATSWTDARNALGGTKDETDPYIVGAYSNNSNDATIWRTFWTFDLTALAGKSIVSAELFCGCRTNSNGGGMVAVIGTQSEALSVLDYNNFTFSNYAMSTFTLTPASGLCLSYITLSCTDSTELGRIENAFGSLLKLVLLHVADNDNDEPGGIEMSYDLFRAGECFTNCHCQPVLLITYS